MRNLPRKLPHSALGDFNGDGRLDIAYFSPKGLSVLWADEASGYHSCVNKIQNIKTYYSGEDVKDVRHLVGDINGDGLDDILLFLNNETPVQILLSKTETKEGFILKEIKHVKLPWLSQASPVLTDVNGDGRFDLVSFIQDKLYIHYGNGDKDNMFSVVNEVALSTLSFSQETHLHARQYVHHLAGDLNGDGLGDILSVTQTGELQTLLGTNHQTHPFRRLANQTQTPVQKLQGHFNPGQLQLQDMNGDGCADLVVIQDDGSYTLSYGQKNGILSAPSDDKTREEHGQSVAYRPNLLAKQNEEKIVGINPQGPDGHRALISLNDKGEVNAYSFKSVRQQDLIHYYRVGDGKDERIGQKKMRNYFDVGAGTKKFTGGPYADVFLLQGKLAPSQLGHLDGAGTDDEDTVIGAVKPDNGRGYEIDLQEGYVKYTDDEKSNDVRKLIATLSGIEHAMGHSETNDILVGDDNSNQLNGRGGKDKLIGQGGDDTLSLSAGRAVGGKGKDTYCILQNTTQYNSAIEVEESESSHEYSNMVLNHTAANLMKASLKDADIVLTLRNDNQTQTEVILKDMYRGLTQDGQRRRQHNYQLKTRDGATLGVFSETLSQTQEREGGMGRLILMHLYDKAPCIDNETVFDVPERDIYYDKESVLIEDKLELPWLLEDTVLKTEGKDILLSDNNEKFYRVRIKHFMRQNQNARHLSLVDANGNDAPLVLTQDHVSIGVKPKGTQQNDDVVIRHNSTLNPFPVNVGPKKTGQNTATPLDLGEGNDTFVDLSSGGYNLIGGKGNDAISLASGDNSVTGGPGQDKLELGRGDDTYYFAQGDGVDTVRDQGGQDTLVITTKSLTRDNLHIFRENSDLLIEIGRSDSGDRVRFINHYTEEDSKLEFVKVGEQTFKVEELVQSIASFSSSQNTTVGSQEEVSHKHADALQPVVPSYVI